MDPRLLNLRQNKAKLVFDPDQQEQEEQQQQPSRMTDFFYADSDSHEIVKNKDLTGYCAIVVGANRGLGYEICRTLAFANCHVIMACRNLQSGDSALKMIQKEKVISK